MELPEVKQIIETYHQAGRSREETVTLISALPINGEEAEAFEYIDLKYKTTTDLPEILVTNRSLKDKTADTIAAVARANKPPQIFRHGRDIARITKDAEGAAYVEPMTENAIRGFLERVANYQRISPKGETMPVSAPPLEVVRDFMNLPDTNLPFLLNITDVPVMRQDGSIFDTPGYDERTGLYFAPLPNLVLPTIPNNPSDAELRGAIALIQEPLTDFPFDSPASFANAIAAMITPVFRPTITGSVPLCLFDKPQAGTGASLMAEVIVRIATGHAAGMIAAPRQDEEWEKKLVALLRRGRPIVVIDNIEGVLYSPSLAMILTARVVEARILGQSEIIRLPNQATYIATGNNVRLTGDLPRRCYLSRMDALDARPWMRDPKYFKYRHLIQWVMENRGEIIGAILTIGSAWIAAGRPIAKDLPNLGGFEEWVTTIGSILAFAGIDGFLSNLDYLYSQSDIEAAQWQGFLEAWLESLGDQPVVAAEIIKQLHDNDDFGATLPDGVDRDPKKINRSLGNALGKRAEARYPNGLMITKASKKKHAVAWRVVSYRTPNLPDLATKGELGELAPTPRSFFNNNNEYRVEEDSPNSLSGTKMGELGGSNSPNDLPSPYPDQPCHICGGDFWLRGNEWVCQRCHPKPENKAKSYD